MNGIDVMIVILIIGGIGWIGGRASRTGRIEQLKEQRDSARAEVRTLRARQRPLASVVPSQRSRHALP